MCYLRNRTHTNKGNSGRGGAFRAASNSKWHRIITAPRARTLFPRLMRCTDTVMTERWQDIKGFEGYYQVSSLGQIKSLPRCWASITGETCTKEVIMTEQPHRNGYKQVHLRRPGVHRKYFIHRLVGAAFLPNPEDKREVNHKDRDKTHNCAFGCARPFCDGRGNLEWSTEDENRQHWRADDAAKSMASDMEF